MNRHTLRPFKVSLTFVVAASLLTLKGCGFEVENPGNPEPKPKKETDTAKNTSPESSTDSPTGGSETIRLPSCTLTIERATDNSSPSSGARVSLPQTGEYNDTTLVWRNPSSGLDENAGTLTFGAAHLPAGNYTFKFTRPSGYSCNALVEVTQSDINSSINLVLKITLP
jgi:hypothetical protein